MKILCIGDSLTYGFGIPRPKTWVALAARETGYELVNLGVNGDTTGGMLARFPLALAQKPKVVLVMGGANDLFLGGTAEQAQTNIGAMVFQAFGAGVIPIVGVPADFCEATLSPEWASFVDLAAIWPAFARYCAWLPRFCGHFGAALLDFNAALHAEARQSDLSDLLYDGLHPNDRGHAVMAQAAAQFLKTIL